MKKLEYITEDVEEFENSTLKRTKNGSEGYVNHYVKQGKIITVKVPNPIIDPSSVIDYISRSSIPKMANAFVVSDFNPDTQFIENGKQYSAYAVLFYSIWW